MNLEQEIQAAIDYAHTIAAEKGANSKETAADWDVVEELQAEAAHQRAKHPTTFEEYCDDNPDAVEARMYED
ncbi:MAG: Calvin cycle protein CP12 [Thermosynechococcaceae cyanobacterium]